MNVNESNMDGGFALIYDRYTPADRVTTPASDTSAVDSVETADGSTQVDLGSTERSKVEVYPRPEIARTAGGAAVNSAAGRAEQLAQLKVALANDYPDLRTEARTALQDSLLQHHLHLDAIDPDHTWLNGFQGGSSSTQTYNGWEHHRAPLESMSLTDLQLRNFPADFGGDPNSLNADTGVYTQGLEASSFGVHNEVRLLSTDLRQTIRDGDFYTAYHDKLKAYYDRNIDGLKAVAEANVLEFSDISRAHSQRSMALGMDQARADALGLSEKAMAMLAEVAGSADPGAPLQGVHAYVFDIDSWQSRDMTWLRARDGHVVLLMPGDERSVREYANLDGMRADVRRMTESAVGREELARHFSTANRRDGMTYQGIDKWLTDIAGGGYDSRIAYQPSLISGNLFRNQVTRMRDADLDNVRYLIKSNAAVDREELIQAFGAFNGVMGNPLTQVAELGLQIMEVRNATWQQDRDHAVAGAWKTGVGLGLNLLLMGMIGPGAEPAAAGAPGTSRFRMPTRLADGRIGHLLGPVDPPRLPEIADESAAGAVGGASGQAASATNVPLIGDDVRINEYGLREHRNFEFLYRAVRKNTVAMQDPARYGFHDSGWFAVPRMLDGPAVVTSSTPIGAIKFGEGMFPEGFELYKIDAKGLPAVSLEENVVLNPRVLSRHMGYQEDTIEYWRRNGVVGNNVGDGALDYDEVHLSNRDLGAERITRVPPAGYPDLNGSGYVSLDERSSVDLDEVASSGEDESINSVR